MQPLPSKGHYFWKSQLRPDPLSFGVNHTLTPSQSKFFFDDAKFTGFVAGFGSGKTVTGVLKLLNLCFRYPNVPQGYFAPTYPLVRDIFFPTLTEILEPMQVRYEINKHDGIVYIKDGATIITRTMDVPDRIVGFEIGHALVDEFDILQTDKAMQVWRKILGRLRAKYPDGRSNGAFITTTPEGFRATHKLFVQDKTPEFSLTHGSTYENRVNLPDGYIETLEASYPPQVIQAYLNGQFVNLTTGRVYPNFDRTTNHVPDAIQDREPLHIGMDFNVNKQFMSVAVIRNNQPFILKEYHSLRDTPESIQVLKHHYPQHHITIYPDASGRSRHTTNASESDLSLLHQAGFSVRAYSRNPAVRDRIMSVDNGFAKQNIHINVKECPKLTQSLEQQTYDQNGVPDKQNDFDHGPDSLGYLVHYRWPIKKPNARMSTVAI